MNNGSLDSGIAAVGSIPWGTHFCQFYRTQEDLIETLVPYFRAGLESNECCLWVTSEQLNADVAKELMRSAIPDFDKFLDRNQMQIVSIADWYKAGDVFEAEVVLNSWIEREQHAIAAGYNGLRLTGDTFWLERSGWHDFMDYENKVNGAFHKYKLVALCTYSTEKCSAEDMLDVCCHHEFALARRKGDWKLLESSSLKIAKEHLNTLNDELELRVEKRTEELNNALRSRDEFLAMLGHELRNPLAPIRNATEVIRLTTSADSPLNESIKILTRQVGHITNLVDDLLDIARITHGHISLNFFPASLCEIINHAIEISSSVINERRHSLNVNIDPEILVNVDSTRMAQVFGNLLHNAAKYTPEHGSISVTTFVDEGKVFVKISDSGVGIPSEMLSSIFELFTQLPRSLARSDGGLGIGLTLVKRIVEMHQGQVSARSAGVGHGSEFTVELPIYIKQEKVAENYSPAPSAILGSNTQILIVDDNEDSSKSLSMLLEINGYKVNYATDGIGGLDMAKRLKPSVALLDIGLPGLNGYDIAKHLRNDPATQHMRLIAVTGYGQANDLELAKDAGFDAHLLKPVELHQLLMTIENN